MLERVGASMRAHHSRQFPFPLETVEFKSQSDAVDVLNHVWTEHDSLRGPLIGWFESLVRMGPFELRIVASALATLMHSEFNSVFLLVLQPWLASNDSQKVECADIAIALAGENEQVESFIARKMQDWVSNKADRRLFLMGLRLTCGQTGFRHPEASVKALQNFEAQMLDAREESTTNRNVGTFIREMRGGFDRFMRGAAHDDFAKATLKHYLAKLDTWVNAPSAGNDERTNLPIYIFLQLMGMLSAGQQSIEFAVSGPEEGLDGEVQEHSESSERGRREGCLPARIFLSDLLVDGQAANAPLVRSIASLFTIALARSGKEFRDGAKSIIGRWCKEAACADDESGADLGLVSLLKALYAEAPDQDSKERVQYMAASVVSLG
jgi:hypothetical protein